MRWITRGGGAALTSGVDRSRLEAAVSRMGRPLALAEHGLVPKPWSSHGYTHRVMTAVLGLAPQLRSAHAIAAIEIDIPDFDAAVLPFMAPETRAEALFSLPFAAAMGLCRGGLPLADLESAPWSQAEIRRLMALTHVRPFAPRRPNAPRRGAAEHPHVPAHRRGPRCARHPSDGGERRLCLRCGHADADRGVGLIGRYDARGGRDGHHQAPQRPWRRRRMR